MGAGDHIVNPFPGEALPEKIKDCLKNKRTAN